MALTQVTTGMLADASITQAKMAAGVAGNGPAFSAYQSSLQTLSNNTETKLQINTEEFDTAGAYDSATNYRFTPLVAGYYQINFSCYGGGSVNTTLVTAKIVKNGSQYFDYTQGRGGAYSYIPAAFSDGVSSGSQLVYLNGSTDYIEIYGRVVGTGTISAKGAVSGSLVRAA